METVIELQSGIVAIEVYLQFERTVLLYLLPLSQASLSLTYEVCHKKFAITKYVCFLISVNKNCVNTLLFFSMIYKYASLSALHQLKSNMGETACCNKENSTLDLRDRLGFPSSPRKEGAVLPSLGMIFRPVLPKRVIRVGH